MCDSETRYYNRLQRLEREFMASMQSETPQAAWVCGDKLAIRPEFRSNADRLPRRIEVVNLGSETEFRVVEGNAQFREGEYFKVRTGQVQEMYVKSPSGPA